MKRLILAFFLFAASPSFAASIYSITIPPNICPNETRTFKVNYYITASPYVNDNVYEIVWDFSLNGTLLFSKKSNSNEFIHLGIPFGEGRVSVSNLPLGNIKVKVTLKYIITTMGGSAPTSDSDSKTFTVGLSAPSPISGSANICNGVAYPYSISPITNASSYTWEVPVGWTVNGILGPIVTGQGNSVSIASCSGSSEEVRSSAVICAPQFSVNQIKVKAVSATCGETGYATKSVTVDYPVKITQTYPSTSSVTFSASPSNLSNYTWTLPSAWTASVKTGPTITVNHNSTSGTAVVNYVGNCSLNPLSASSFFNYSAPGGGGTGGGTGGGDCGGGEPLPVTAYPNPATNYLNVDVPCEQPLSVMQVEERGSFRNIESSRNGNQYSIDVSSLKPGLHVLRIKKAGGRDQYVRFMKSK